MIKWYGIATTYQKVLEWCAGIRAYHPVEGMWPYQMRYVLKTLKMNFRVKKKFTMEDLDALLDSGGACIFIYDTAGGSHCVFIDARSQEGYRSWNRKKGMPPFFSREDMKKAIEISTRKKGGLYVYTFQAVKR